MPTTKAKAATFSEELRERVQERVNDRAAKDDRRHREGPQAAKEIGIAYTTLWRFLYRRKGLSSGATDKVVAWLEGK